MTEHVLNIERLTILRDTIQALDPSRFDMANWVSSTDKDDRYRYQGVYASELMHTCDTAGCIGGWAEALFLSESQIRTSTSDQVGEVLGLSHRQRYDLFFPGAGPTPIESPELDQITQAHAVETLTKLIETGEIDWSHAL